MVTFVVLLSQLLIAACALPSPKDTDQPGGVTAHSHDPQTVHVGNWRLTASQNAHDADYHVGKLAGGASAVTFSLPLPAGIYDFQMWFYGHSNRDNSVPVTVATSSGVALSSVTVNQQISLTDWHTFASRVAVQDDTTVAVTVSTQGTEGFVVADAVRAVPLDASTTSSAPTQGHEQIVPTWVLDTSAQETSLSLVGEWSTRSSSHAHGGDYLIGKESGGAKTATVTHSLPAGHYSVELWFYGHQNRDSRVPVTIAAGKAYQNTVFVNQKLETGWHHVDDVVLQAAGDVAIMISASGTSEFVVADAIRIVQTSGSVSTEPTTERVAVAAVVRNTASGDPAPAGCFDDDEWLQQNLFVSSCPELYSATVQYGNPAVDDCEEVRGWAFDYVANEPKCNCTCPEPAPSVSPSVTVSPSLTPSVSASRGIPSESPSPIYEYELILDAHDNPESVVLNPATWATRTSSKAYGGSYYIGKFTTNQRTATFTGYLPRPGPYRLSLWFYGHPNRAVQVPVTIEAAAAEGGPSFSTTINQEDSTNDWKELTDSSGSGLMLNMLEAGTVAVTVSTEGTNSDPDGQAFVIVDAFRALLAPTPSVSVTPSLSPSVTATPSTTTSVTSSSSITPSITVTPTTTTSVTPTRSATPSLTPTRSLTPSITSSPSKTPSITPTISESPSASTSFVPVPVTDIQCPSNGLLSEGVVLNTDASMSYNSLCQVASCASFDATFSTNGDGRLWASTKCVSASVEDRAWFVNGYRWWLGGDRADADFQWRTFGFVRGNTVTLVPREPGCFINALYVGELTPNPGSWVVSALNCPLTYTARSVSTTPSPSPSNVYCPCTGCLFPTAGDCMDPDNSVCYVKDDVLGCAAGTVECLCPGVSATPSLFSSPSPSPSTCGGACTGCTYGSSGRCQVPATGVCFVKDSQYGCPGGTVECYPCDVTPTPSVSPYVADPSVSPSVTPTTTVFPDYPVVRIFVDGVTVSGGSTALPRIVFFIHVSQTGTSFMKGSITTRHNCPNGIFTVLTEQVYTMDCAAVDGAVVGIGVGRQSFKGSSGLWNEENEYFEVASDTTPPTVSIAAQNGLACSNAVPLVFVITLSEATASLAYGALTHSNCADPIFGQTSDTVYTLTCNTDSFDRVSVSASVGAYSFSDLGGNMNEQGASAVVLSDTMPPRVTIHSYPSYHMDKAVPDDPLTFTFELDEASTDFELHDVTTVVNCDGKQWYQHSDVLYTLTCPGLGFNTRIGVGVGINAFSDCAGNMNDNRDGFASFYLISDFDAPVTFNHSASITRSPSPTPSVSPTALCPAHEYYGPLDGHYLAECTEDGCEDFTNLTEALLRCSEHRSCGGVTYSAWQSVSQVSSSTYTYQTRLSSQPEVSPYGEAAYVRIDIGCANSTTLRTPPNGWTLADVPGACTNYCYQSYPNSYLPTCAESCASYANLATAQTRCTESASCVGVTYTTHGPATADNPYQLRAGSTVTASDAGESSWLYECCN